MADKTCAHGVAHGVATAGAVSGDGSVRMEMRVSAGDTTLALTSKQARYLMNLPLDAVRTMIRGDRAAVEVLFAIWDDKGEKRTVLSLRDLERVQEALRSLCPQGGTGVTHSEGSSYAYAVSGGNAAVS